MFPRITREQSQILSVSLMLTGVVLFSMTTAFTVGMICIGVSCWILMISESLLLSKVQLEMSQSLDSFRKKQDREIQDLLHFLRDAQISSSPFDNLEGAKKLLKNIPLPAMVLTPNHQIVLANGRMHDLLGWGRNELNGRPAHIINESVVMSRIGEIAASEEYRNAMTMITMYVYLHKSGKRIFGQLDVSKVGLEGYFAVFHPSDLCAMTHEEILGLL